MVVVVVDGRLDLGSSNGFLGGRGRRANSYAGGNLRRQTVRIGGRRGGDEGGVMETTTAKGTLAEREGKRSGARAVRFLYTIYIYIYIHYVWEDLTRRRPEFLDVQVLPHSTRDSLDDGVGHGRVADDKQSQKPEQASKAKKKRSPADFLSLQLFLKYKRSSKMLLVR